MTEKKTGGKGKSVASVMSDRTDGAQAIHRLHVLSRAVEQSPSVVVITDATGKIEYVNPRFTAVTGYTAEEAIGKYANEFGGRSSEYQQRIWKTLSSGREWRGEFLGKRKCGEAYWLSASITPIRSGDDVVTNYVGVGEDVTGRKQAEVVLQESDDEWRSLVENIPDIVMTLDRDCRILSINRTVPGLTREEVIGASGFDYLPPEHHNTVRRALKRVFETGDSHHYETAGTGPYGRTSWYFNRIGPIMRDGSVVAAALIVTDITERKRAEEALRRSEEKYRDLVENLNDVIYEVDATGRITYISPAAEQAGDYALTDLLGRPVTDLVHSDDRASFQESFKGFLRGDAKALEFRLMTKSGEVRWHTSFARPIVKDGRVVGIRGVLTDINERKRAEEALRASEERFRSTLDNMMEGCLIVGFDWRYLYANDATAANTRRTKEEILGRTMMEAHEGIERTQEFAYLRRCMEERIPHQMEWEYAYSDGDTAWFDVSVQPVPEGIFLTFLNITERKRSVEALRESEERYRRLVELSPYAIAVHSEGKMVFVNRAGVDLFGAESADEIIGRPLWDFVHPDYLDAVRERVQRTRPEGTEVDMVEEKLVRLDGTVIDVEMAAIPITYQGKPARQAVLRDISERKRAEEALREREETMLALLNAPTESALLADVDGTILAMNEIAAQRLGKSVEEIVGGRALGLMPPDAADFRKGKGDEVVRSGKPCRFQDTRKGRWYDTTIYPISDADGKVVRLAIFSSDITEIKEMEEALQRTREELDSKVERQMQRGDPYGLTYRELTVLHLVVAGSSDKEIGTTLGISTPTASKHIANILSKMHASSRTEAGVRALKEGLLD